jgi:hypothetical protein
VQGRCQLGALAAAMVWLLAACGGGGGGPAAAPEGRGTLVEAAAGAGALSRSAIDAAAQARGWLGDSGAAACDVQVQALHYRTVGVAGEPATASGVLLLPAGPCAGRAHPLVAYGRSTEVHRPRTLANPADPETLLLAAIYAGQGYAVVATEYLGYARSAYPYHPYLHAETEAASLVDAIRAARHAAAALGVPFSGRVMLTGYSQGAHASMAAQRTIEEAHAAEIALAGAAHLAGPYDLAALVRGAPVVGEQYLMPFLVTSWQKVYGSLYPAVGEAFRTPYSGYVENLLPHPTHTFVSLRTEGVLPGGESSPQQARDRVFQPAFFAAVRSDPAHPLAQAAERNSLLAWTPRAPTLLCGGTGDPTVSPAMHQAAAQAAFAARGVQVASVDVDPIIQSRYGPGGRAPVDPGSAAHDVYYSAYHTDYEPPLCHVRARDFFDPKR